ncbi:MAG TPA: glycosyltransferase, partial [Thermoleophilaceae bacterium]|nr:glycosyltransferase [Thermoleophilaceae bacterium]
MLRDAVVAVNVLMLAYMAGVSLSYTVLLLIGWWETNDYVRRRALRDYDSVSQSDLSAPVSIIAPAYDESACIVAAVRSLLDSSYGGLEVVVVNDGSSDDTLEVLERAFALVRVERLPRASLDCEPVRGVYASPLDDRLVVIDKENGGKADALNAGLRYARYPLFCAVDSDTILDRDALARLVWQFQQEPETVGVGGIVRIANGSTVRESRMDEIRTPRSLLVNIQIVEYLRAFLTGRTGWSRLGMLLIVSGAFGMFRREVVVAAGGYDTTTVGEDAELVFRLHRHCRDVGRPYRISFIADPVCWTEAPADRATLAKQRDRWQRGLVESMIRHRGMLFRPRYGRIGMGALPYFLVFEALAPLIELLGYAVVLGSAWAGIVDPSFALAYLGLATAYGLVLSLGSLRIEERAFQRYGAWRCLSRLVAASVIENFGYRQWSTWIRARSFWTLARGGAGWGAMTRAGFAMSPESPGQAAMVASAFAGAAAAGAGAAGADGSALAGAAGAAVA